MKRLSTALVGLVLAAAASTGCGPGLGHHGVWAKAPAPAVGTTTVTSGAAKRPLLPAIAWDEDDANATTPALQTWGTPPSVEDKYGF